jgi:hypothetical protein
MDTNIVYEFEIDQKVLPDYRVTNTVLNWLRNNLDKLVDNDNNKIFNRVNIGYNEKSLKGFGSKPICDVYLDNVDYRTDFDLNVPSGLNTFIIITLKGNANNTYNKALDLLDYIVQEFVENTDWRQLDSIVKTTTIEDTQVQINPENKVWSTMIIFQLNHVLV